MAADNLRHNLCLLLAFCLLLGTGVFAQSDNEQLLTIYQNDLALVSQSVVFTLESGSNDLSYGKLSPQFLPESLFVDFPGLKVLSLRYEHVKKTSQNQLLGDYLQKRLVVKTDDGKYAGYLQHSERSFLLFSEKADGSGPVKLISSKTIREIDFPAAEAPLIRGVLHIRVEAAKASGGVTARINYLTSGLGWRANYIGLLDEKRPQMEFDGFALLSNGSGIDFEEVNLTLKAGVVDSGALSAEMPQRMRRGRRVAMPPETDFTRPAKGDGYTYRLQRSFSLENGESAKIPLFDKVRNVTAKRQYLYEPWRDPELVAMQLKFNNNRASQLGFPLPAGEIGIFQKNKDGSLDFLGGGELQSVSAGEEVDVPLGRAVGLKAKRITLKSGETALRERQEVYRVTLSNQKSVPVEITVTEKVPPAVSIQNSSEPYTMTEATTAAFLVKLAAGAKKELEYTLRFKY